MRKHINQSLSPITKKLRSATIAMLLLISFCVICIPLTVSAETNELNQINTTSPENELSKPVRYSVEQVADALFGDVSINSSEYLCNLDDSADYIYVTFEKEGYAVFLKETMELLEYSAQGKLSYPETKSTKYYGGPGVYMIADNDHFVDVLTHEHLYVTKESAETYAKVVREKLLTNYTARAQSKTIEFDYSILEDENIPNVQSNSVLTEEPLVQDAPVYNKDALIRLTDGTYIPNYRYFISNPRHGSNSTGTCGAVAAQLLLSYHNYYSDRRIVANNYLNGSTSDPEGNPNLCTDPMRMTSYTLGTRGNREDGSDDANSYFHYVVNKIPASATTSSIKNGLNNILSDRNNEISGTINYTVNSKEGGWFFGLLPVDSSGIISELDAGRPVILGMQESLGGTDHAVVAYGYNSYTYSGSSESYLGYITHFGWKTKFDGTNFLNIWVNASWCYSYITLNIDHTHNYYTYGTIPGTNRTESRCLTCGHRTDAVIQMAAHDRYIERGVTLPQNGLTYKDYYLTFATAGNKLFQTFGSDDARLYLFDAEYNQLAHDDDHGAGTNSLFKYTVEANKPYILRVKFFSNPTETNTKTAKIGITPASIQYSVFESIWNATLLDYEYTFTDPLNTTRVFRFNPTEDGTYTFTTGYLGTARIDAYLYLVDTYSTNLCLQNDDGAGDLQALITAELIAGRDYFIVVSPYNITTTSGGMSLTISKVS